METLIYLIFPPWFYFSVLYSLNKILNYKAWLVGILGIIKYRIILIAMVLITSFVIIFKADSSPFASPVFWAYMYLFYIPDNLR
ncbi:MAG: hypothetical protein K0R93_1020 [Anaerosolibacter sp.]|jgi:hypothetical protein|nr:hypothetical protein [Anaerosolibacter sp.]